MNFGAKKIGYQKNGSLPLSRFSVQENKPCLNRFFQSTSLKSGDNSLYYPNEQAYMPYGDYSTGHNRIDYTNNDNTHFYTNIEYGCPPFENARKGAFSQVFTNVTSKYSIFDVENDANITSIKNHLGYPRRSETIERL
jgi:hypothetical protein